MMRTVWAVLVSVILLVGVVAHAATWDEPFHREVVLGADSFGLFETVSVTPFTTTFKRIRALAGVDTGETAKVDGFYESAVPATTSTRPGQAYDDEWTLRFRSGRRYYLFLKRAPPAGDGAGALRGAPVGAPDAAGESWRIATPTGGLAEVQPDGMVIATYRHSLHQALLDASTFELTQTCIFDALHRARPCSPEVQAFIDAQLANAPASLDGTPSAAERESFFKQHAALETAYLIGQAIESSRLDPFLQSPFFHTQISAVRALARSQGSDRNTRLATFVTDDTRDPLARVFGVAAIREVRALDLKDRLTAYLPSASTQRVGLGAGVSDSRIGTVFPASLRDALAQLLNEWK
jgi:hypothetical protein